MCIQAVFPSVVFLVLLQILLHPSSTVLGQQRPGQWRRPPRVPSQQWGQMRPPQLAPLPLLFQNSGQMHKLEPQRMSSGHQKRTISSPNTGPVLGGKIHLLSTLWRGMRNTGLEKSIAGDVLEKVLKISLRDIIVPFKRDYVIPLIS